MNDVVLLVIGAAIGAVPTFASESLKRREERRTRMVEREATIATDLTGDARHLWSVAARLIDGSAEPAPSDRRPALILEVERLKDSVRMRAEQLRLLGSKNTGEAGRELRRAAFRAAEAAIEAELHPTPAGRDRLTALSAAITDVHTAVRRDLGVTGAVGEDRP